jgi:hypothetical protein
MKIRRTLNRRGVSVGTAGWFTVLRPDRWSAASRQPGSLHPLTDPSNRAASTLALGQKVEQKVLNHTDDQDATMAPSMMQFGTHDLRLKRSALILSAAMTITSVLLWWIMHP